MATFIKQPNGDTLVRVRIKGYPAVSRQFKAKKEAREWAVVIEGEMLTGAWQDPTKARDTLLKDLIDEYIREVVCTRKSQHCINDETLRLRRIGKALGSYSLATLSQQIVAAYRDARLKKVKPATVSRELAILAAVLNWACRERGIPISVNVASGRLVKRPKISNARNRRLNPAEEIRLFAALSSCKNPLIPVAVRLLLVSGMRCGELLKVRWKDVDFSNCAIYLEDTKNGSARAVPLTLAAERILRALPHEADFEQRVLEGLTYEGLKQAFERARRRADLQDLRLHDLRHEAASRAAESGQLTLSELQLFTGHKDVRMVTRYTHILPGGVVFKLRQAGM